jgi:hypothetical protein
MSIFACYLVLFSFLRDLPLVIYMVYDCSFFGFTADCVLKKGTFGNFTGFGHLQMSETPGRNMAVELDSRHPLLPKTG